MLYLSFIDPQRVGFGETFPEVMIFPPVLSRVVYANNVPPHVHGEHDVRHYQKERGLP